MACTDLYYAFWGMESNAWLLYDWLLDTPKCWAPVCLHIQLYGPLSPHFESTRLPFLQVAVDLLVCAIFNVQSFNHIPLKCTFYGLTVYFTIY